MVNITTLDNGLRIVTQNMPGLETVYMGIFNSVGNRDEKKEINGAAHFLRRLAVSVAACSHCVNGARCRQTNLKFLLFRLEL